VNPSESASTPSPRAFPGVPTTLRSSGTDTQRWESCEPRLELVLGDLTDETTDAIVNPVGAGLVDLAVRRAAGPELLDAYHLAAAELPAGRLLPGRALATPGFRLAARHVIHTRPPAYADDPARARRELAACYQSSLRLAAENGFRSISFPAIATGVYRFPVAEAAEVAVGALRSALREWAAPGVVRFVFSQRATFDAFVEAARRQLGERPAWGERGPTFTALVAA
jgi:O-acetyl-ADP-ribose deacetylase (regulator of RNase III)